MLELKHLIRIMKRFGVHVIKLSCSNITAKKILETQLYPPPTIYAFTL